MKIPASKTVHFQLPSLQLLKKVPGRPPLWQARHTIPGDSDKT